MAVPPASDHLVLAALTAVLFGLDPILTKRGLAAGGTWMGNALLMLVTRAGVFWAVLLATGGLAGLDGLTPTGAVAFAAGGLLGSALGRIFLYVGVERVGSSLANAFTNARPLFAVLLAIGWLGEVVTPAMGIGVVLLVAGLGALSLSRGGDLGGWRRVDLAFPLAAAVAFAMGNVVRRFGLIETPTTVLQGIAVGEVVALVAVGTYAVGTGRTEVVRAPRRAQSFFLGNGVVASLGILTLFEALDRGPVSVVDPLVATAPLFTLAFAAVLLRDVERVTRGLAAGVALVVVGVVLITTG